MLNFFPCGVVLSILKWNLKQKENLNKTYEQIVIKFSSEEEIVSFQINFVQCNEKRKEKHHCRCISKLKEFCLIVLKNKSNVFFFKDHMYLILLIISLILVNIDCLFVHFCLSLFFFIFYFKRNIFLLNNCEINGCRCGESTRSINKVCEKSRFLRLNFWNTMNIVLFILLFFFLPNQV